MGFGQLVSEALATDALGRLWIPSAPVPREGIVDSYLGHQEPHVLIPSWWDERSS